MKSKKFFIILISISTLFVLPFALKNNSFFLVNSESIENINLEEINVSLEDQIWDIVAEARGIAILPVSSQNNNIESVATDSNTSVSSENINKAILKLDEAWQLNQTILEPKLQNYLYLKLIDEYLKLKVYDEAIVLINNPEYNNDNIDYSSSLKIVGTLKVTQAYLADDKLDEALEFTQNIDTEFPRYKSLAEIVKYYGKKGNFDEAIDLLLTFPNDTYIYEQYLGAVGLLEIYIANNQLDKGLAFIDTFKSANGSNDNVISLSGKLIEYGIENQEFNIAQESINRIDNKENKVYYLKLLADAFIENEEIELAKIIIDEAFELDKNNEYFNENHWARYFLLIGEEDKVKAFSNQLSGGESEIARDRDILAHAYLSIGYLEEAFELTRLIPPRILLPLEEYPDPKDELLYGILNQALEKNNLDLAQKIVPEFAEKEDQILSLQIIANYYYEIGKKEEAITNLNKALTITQEIESIFVVPERLTFWSEPNVSLLLNLAQDYHKFGDNNQALKVLEMAIISTQNFDNEFANGFPAWTKSQALINISNIYLEIDESDQVLPILEMAEIESLSLLEDENSNDISYVVGDMNELIKFYSNFNEYEKSLQLLNDSVNILNNFDIVENEWHISSYIYSAFDVAKLASEMGENDIAINVINKTLPHIENTENTSWKNDFYKRLTYLYLTSNQIEKAEVIAFKNLDLIKAMTYQEAKISALKELSINLITEDSMDLALTILPHVETRRQRAKMLIAIASHYKAQDNIIMQDKAIDIALQILPTIHDLEARQELEKDIKDIH